MQRTALILGLCLISSAAWLGEAAFVAPGASPCAVAPVMEGSCCCGPAARTLCPCDVAPAPILPLREERSPDRGQVWTLPELRPLLEVVAVTADEEVARPDATETARPVPARHLRRLALIGVFRN